MTDLVETPDGRAHVLAGLGGMGKSTVALRVAEVALAQGRRVWWVRGLDGSSLASALLGLAQVLGADAGAVEAARAGRTDPSDVVWGRLEAHRGWVLVIDNADDLELLEVAGRPVGDGNGWVRGSRAGLVVVTSRDGDMRHWGRGVELHPVGWLSDEDGGRVLLDLAPRAGDRAEAEALSARLGGLALALHHAGSQLSSPFSAEQSFARYRAALEAGFAALLGPPGAVDDREVVTRTWEVSLEQLAGGGVPQARELLGVLAWFAGAVPIPVEGLDREVLGRVCRYAGPAGVGVGLEALVSVGLIETSTSAGDAASGQQSGRGRVMMHPLVAETIRHQFGAGDAGRLTASVAVDLLAAATGELDAQDPGDWPTWSAWLPHLEELLSTASTLVEEASLVTLANAAADAALTLVWAGSYAAALAVAEAGLHSTRRLGAEHRATIELRNREADAHNFLGHAAEAERLYRDVLQARERVLGTDHPNTLATRHEIARMVAKQGDAAEAERLYRDVLQARERVLGTDHPDTLGTRHEIARTVAKQGDAAEAERLYRDVLHVEEQVLGTDHPQTLATRYEIARMVAEQGDAAEGERLFRDVLHVEERVLGTDHPSTLATRHEIARMVTEQGDAAEAERLYRDVLQARERVLGTDHPNTLTTRHEIARIVAEQGDAAEAERLYRDVLQARERVLGTDHPNTLTTRHEIARIVAEQGDAAEAERLYRDVLQARERVLGTDHPSTRITARSLRALTEPTDEAADE
ncbi:tetratricopeptide repeat protein [Actinoallomurus sp. NBC_01490]|uniref:tetratricopeptide repeat protein n=1 Tax=Actinoallomurus sp. NBC_01490 TaxID=2903557 RepID=UPI002E3645F2|nr:tetratricopeptide repeat protein [Actinoallomurus sp. NBC_01490]